MLGRWYDLLQKYDRCEGRALNARLRIFRICLLAFNRNFDDLMNAIQAITPPIKPPDETVFEFGDRIEPQLSELCRHLQNFISSAMMLVDQTRVLYGELYKPDAKMPTYGDEIKSRFAENGLHQFIQGLRNMTTHCRFPVIAYAEHRHIGITSTSVDHQVFFQKDDLLKYGGWSSLAKSFIEDAPEKIDVATVMRDYHSLVVAFHEWFSEIQRAVHREQLEEMESLELELRKVADDVRANWKARLTESPPEQSR